MHSIVYNPIHDEIVVPQQFGQAILTFRGGTDGEEAPIRIIQGPRTQLSNIDRLAVDPINNEIFVPLEGFGDVFGRILVFPREGNGDIAPLRVLQGPDTGFGHRGASAVAVDPIRDLLIVGGGGDDGTRFRIFKRTDEGNVKPTRVIGGPRSGLTSISGPFAYHPPTGKIITGVRGAAGELGSDESFAAVWNITDDGDVPPQYTFGGPKGILRMPRGVAIDERHKSVIVTDKRLNAIITFYLPEIF